MAPSFYQVYFRLARARTVQVGRLGRFRFAPGVYFYTGSARRGLAARLRRHLSRDKKPHWHIDYLLALPDVRVDFLLVWPSEAVGGECDLHRRALAGLAASTPVAGFGSSDCRGGCASHLGRLDRTRPVRAILRRLGIAGIAEPARVIVPGKVG